MVNKDIQSIAPENQTIELASGVFVDVVPLKTREFFKLIKIITNGAGPVLGRMDLFESGLEDNEFAGKLIGLVIMAVPNADDEAVEFIQAMVRPSGLIEKSYADLNKADRERNEFLWDQLFEQTANPEIEDTISIIEAIIKREAGDLQRLGKRIRSMLEVAQKTGQLGSQGTTSSADSAERSTSSVANTTGTTNESSDSLSEESDKSSQPSQRGGRTKKETVVAL